MPTHRSKLIFDLDSTVVTVFGKQEDAAVGYNPRYRGKKSYDPLLCMEANSSYLWDVELRPGNAGTWDGSVAVLDTSFANVPPDIRELRVRAGAGFGFNPVFVALEARPAQYAVVARLTPAFKRLLPGISYEPVNRKWEMAEFEHRSQDWPQARRFVVARRFIQQEEAETTLFSMGRYIYRAWVTNLPLTPTGIWHFYDGRAGMEPRICELREDFVLRKIPTASFAANALYREIVRLAYNLVTAFQRNCLDESWQNLTLQKLRYKLYLPYTIAFMCPPYEPAPGQAPSASPRVPEVGVEQAGTASIPVLPATDRCERDAKLTGELHLRYSSFAARMRRTDVLHHPLFVQRRNRQKIVGFQTLAHRKLRRLDPPLGGAPFLVQHFLFD